MNEIKIVYRQLEALVPELIGIKHSPNMDPSWVRLINQIPVKHLLRFKGKARTILIIKRGERELLLVDTGREKLNQEKIINRYSIGWLINVLIGKTGRKEIAQFLTDPETEIELIYIPGISREDARKKSTFAPYL